jgi:hypothetical protein
MAVGVKIAKIFTYSSNGDFSQSIWCSELCRNYGKRKYGVVIPKRDSAYLK